MKNITIKIFACVAVLGVLGLLYWYYDSGGEMGSSQSDSAVISDTAIDAAIDTTPDASSSATISENSVPKKVKKIAVTHAASTEVSSSDVTDATIDKPSSLSLLAPTPTSAAVSALPPTPHACPLPDAHGGLSRSVIFNEVAWMGSLPQAGEAQAKASNREWIELKNVSTKTVDLAGWQILDVTGKLKISIVSSSPVLPGGFYLLVRDGQSLLVGGSSTPADMGYSGGLSNMGGQLALLDPDCNLSDFLDAAAGWPAGNNGTKQTLEHDVDGMGWHTSVAPGGTPRAENSMVAPAAPATTTSAFPTPVSSASVPSSSPAMAPIQIPTPTIQPSSSSSSTIASSSDVQLPSSSPSAPIAAGGHLFIAAIQIAGGSGSNDFVKIFNPTDASVDLGGWKLHKKSSTGTDYSLKVIANGNMIQPGGYFVWANSTNGFAASIGADVSSTETLSADNSVALFDASGTIVDQVAWGTGVNQYVEATPYPTNPTASQVLDRIITNAIMADTDNNAADFQIQ